MTTNRYSARQSRELDFCTWCPRLCHFSCPSAHGDASEASTAWGLMSLARHEARGELPLDASIARQFYHCASCGRCGAFCAHGHDVPDVLKIARRRAVDADLMPDVVEALLHERAPVVPAPAAAPERTARIALSLGCSTRAERDGAWVHALLAVVEQVAGAPVDLLSERGVSCCGGLPARAGDEPRAEHHRNQLRHASMPYDLVLSDCAGVRDAAPADRGGTFGSLVEWLAERADALVQLASAERQAVVLHGGCRERRHWDLRDAEHRVLTALGYDAEDAFAIDNQQECCGADAVYAAVAPDGAKRAAEAVVRGACPPAARPVVTSRAACASHLTRASGDVPVRSVLDVLVERGIACAPS